MALLAPPGYAYASVRDYLRFYATGGPSWDDTAAMAYSRKRQFPPRKKYHP